MCVEGRRGRQHDEKRDHIGKAHANHRVEPDALKLPRRLSWRFEDRLCGRVFLDVLDLLRSLPEKQIGADRRAEDGHNNGEIGRRPLDMRDDKVEGDRSPRHADDEYRGDISEQRKRQPAQHLDITRIAHEHFEEHDENGERRDIEPRASLEWSCSAAPIALVGSDVDDIGEHERLPA